MADKTPLRFRRTKSGDDDIFSGFVVLAETVFGAYPSPRWPAWTLVDAAGVCVAGLQCRLLRVLCDGLPVEVAALRNVAVAAEWRGRGLMRDLLERVLPWCDAHAAATLLYAETPKLYARFGFAPLSQHAFEGAAPDPVGAATARDYDAGRDGAVLSRLLATRDPVSAGVGVVVDGGLTLQALGGRDWTTSYDPSLDIMVAWAREDETLVLVDVVAARMPEAASILGALGQRPKRLRTLFAPDKLGWEGAPVSDDTGLMVRGALPPAMRRPFMLPPTVGF